MTAHDDSTDEDGRRGDLPAPASVFLAPTDPANFDRTVASAVDLSAHSDGPNALPDSGSVRFWGVRDGTRNHQQFERMARGDLVLFYRDGEYVGVGRVDRTLVDEGWAAATFWDDAPADRIYTLASFDPLSVPRAAVNAIFGYDTDYYPQGLLGVADTRLPDSVESVSVAVRRYNERHG